ncbi:MAG: hypothetical protein WA152_02435 [Microgenomates group bacterium]
MKDIIIWVGLWYLVWGIYNVYFRWSWEKLKSKKYIPRGLYFLFSFFIIFIVFKDILFFYSDSLVLSLLATNLIGLILNYDRKYYKKFNKDRLFILFQSFNILYQQASIVVAIYLIKSLLANGYSDLYFGLFFGIIHLPLLFMPWIKLKYILVAGCFVIGTVFSYLILNYKFGLPTAFIIHYLYYAWEIYYLKDEEKI